MKTLTIKQRKIKEREKVRFFHYKEVTQISMFYDGKEIKNHSIDLNNPKLKIPFETVLVTRKVKDVKEYLESLGKRTKNYFWLSGALKDVGVLEETDPH